MSELLQYVRSVHRQTAGWYDNWVDPDDLYQELGMYTVRQGPRLLRWLEKGEPHRVTLALRSVARIYGETEKAYALGYEYDDLAWYSPAALAGLVPLALDEEWDGLTGESDSAGSPKSAGPANEGGNLLAMVMDVRCALGTKHVPPGGFDPDDDDGMSNLEWLSERLGGDYPSAPGYQRGWRQPLSNAAAAALTREQG